MSIGVCKNSVVSCYRGIYFVIAGLMFWVYMRKSKHNTHAIIKIDLFSVQKIENGYQEEKYMIYTHKY